MQAKPFNLGPVALTATMTTNILSPGTTTGGVGMGSDNGNLQIVLKHIRVVNKTASPATYSLWKGATGANAAGTEIASAITVPANGEYNQYFTGGLYFSVSDFLVGGASAGSTLTLHGYGEIGVQ